MAPVSDRGPRTLIVGGGLAGLAAAAALAGRGVAVTLLESRPRLGGRASSFVDRTTGERIDNCQHVSMGCCTNFAHFCETVGLAGLMRRQPELHFVGPDGAVHRFAAGPLPAPLHLLFAFRRLSYLSSADLRWIARGLRALVRVGPSRAPHQSFADWLHEHRQTPAAIERFWTVVLVSALSETLDRIDVAHARKVFIDGFLANRQSWEVHVPAVPLDELYGSRLVDWLAERGAIVRLQAGVEHVLVEEGRAVGVQLRDGERLAGDDVIVAVPHYLAGGLLPEPLRDDPRLAGAWRLESAPISSVHLWFDRPITPLPHAVFVERLSQWMFNRTALYESASVSDRPVEPQAAAQDGARWYYQVVISASRELAGRPREETVAEVVRELAAVWPKAAAAKLVHSRLVTEHRAVFSVTPGVEPLRPPQQTPIPNLQLAGDWTRTGWPATMEGAVRSGYLAAENVLALLGRPERLVRPDLPVSLGSRLLLGLSR